MLTPRQGFEWIASGNQLPTPDTLVLTAWGGFGKAHYLGFWYPVNGGVRWKMFAAKDYWEADDNQHPKYWAYIPATPDQLSENDGD
jgi:hypothetical protein